MVQLPDFVHVETLTGDPISIGDVRITPESQAFTLRWPPAGALLYHRPLAVLVERAGQTERVPVVDVTRRAWLALAGLTLIFTLLSLFAGGKSGPSATKES